MAADASDRPLSTDDADRAFHPLLYASGVGLAVSGGSDSMALLHLFADWRVRRRPALPAHVLTVDHGLRADAPREARMVAERCAELGLAHDTLVWTGSKPRSGIQAAARRARYRLLDERCVALGLSHVVTAHHLDDQAETILMRLSRGSGLDGLAGMAASVPLSGTLLVRPLLDIPRSRLALTLRTQDRSWCEDPSNADQRFTRARLRRILPGLAEEGLTSRRLSDLARRAARARAALESEACRLQRSAVVADPAGFCRIGAATLIAAPEEIGLRVLARVIRGVGGGNVAPRLMRLERAYEALRNPPAAGAAMTLGGCRIARSGDCVLVFRERGRQPPAPVPVGRSGIVLWDGRFRVCVGGAVAHDEVRPLGREGVAMVRVSSRLRHMPAEAARLSPGLFRDSRLYAAPQVEAGPGPFSPPDVEVEFIGARAPAPQDMPRGAGTGFHQVGRSCPGNSWQAELPSLS